MGALPKTKYAKAQGNAGMGMAIAYFTSLDLPVAVPLTDSQPWDLVVEIDGELKKIQCKTSRSLAPSGGYSVDLRITHHSNTKLKNIPADKSKFDYYFILTDDSAMYLIPSDKVEARSTIVVGNKYTEYRLTMGSWQSLVNCAGL